MERIVLGSGKLYGVEVSAGDDGNYEIPEDSALEVTGNQLGWISGGATLEYTPTFYTVKDDLGHVAKRYITEESVILKSGILTWNGDTLDKLCSTATVTEDTTKHKRTVKIGGADNYDNQMFVLRFVHEDSEAGDVRITIVGNNTSGFEIQFQKDAETVINAEFEAVPGCGGDGILVIFEEEDSSITE